MVSLTTFSVSLFLFLSICVKNPIIVQKQVSTTLNQRRFSGTVSSMISMLFFSFNCRKKGSQWHSLLHKLVFIVTRIVYLTQGSIYVKFKPISIVRFILWNKFSKHSYFPSFYLIFVLSSMSIIFSDKQYTTSPNCFLLSCLNFPLSFSTFRCN